jgi:ABC-type glycerol-3-phosphate transport system substrate-binding protein
MKIKLFLSILVISTLLITVGCKKQQQQAQVRGEIVTLNYYKLFENEENLQPLFNKFQQANPNIRINYKKFNDPGKYLETILSELAEGTGPDIISVPNTWIAQNYKKISPAPAQYANPQIIEDVFVNVVKKDNVFIDSDGTQKVFGIPLSIDTLALYYNDKLFEQFLSELGKPSTTWNGLKANAELLTLPDTENNLIRSGIALGTGEGITRSADIYKLMLLQNGISLFDQNYARVNIANNSKATELLNFYNSFNNLSIGTPSWEDSLGSESEKELYAFVTGKTAMVFGYSYLYQDLLNTIELAKRNGEPTIINTKDIKITEAPQFSNQKNPVALANYYTETVTRNSKHPESSWKLITFLVDPENLKEYYKKEFKPTSRRELISEQKQNPIFAVFANQLGIADSFIVNEELKTNQIIRQLLDSTVNSSNLNLRTLILESQTELDNLIPNEGAYPPSQNKAKK